MGELYGESELLPVLLGWLYRRGRIRFDTLVVTEMPWYGRRIDVATLTRSGSLAAYELKLRNHQRAIEQAAYNKVAFDRSFIVTATVPSSPARQAALEAGLGIIVVGASGVQLVQESDASKADGVLRRRLVRKIQANAGTQECLRSSRII
jgi:hypothetical protein